MLNLSLKKSIQPKLTIGKPNDQYEQEADVMADQVMRMPQTPLPIQRKCEDCEEEQIQMKPLGESITPIIQSQSEEEEELQMKGFEAGVIQAKSNEANSDLSTQLNQTKGSGFKLPESTNHFMSSAFGANFSKVNIHTNSAAVQMNQSLNARAFTHGNDVYFNKGEYSPGSGEGKQLLAHELTHVVQQNGSNNLVQRTTHGPGTPTNCHNWRIPLPPWTAGTIAHGQISALMGVLPHSIPRATKVLMGLPNPPAITPYGFPDLWQPGLAGVGVGEIKSTSAGSIVAQNQASHYKTRHDEWLSRIVSGTGDHKDAAYLASVGGPIPGALIDLSSRTGTDLNLGPFWGDPLKQLHVEADALGAMVYWCTGVGLPFNPVWYPVFREVMKEIKRLLDEAARALRGVGEAIAEGLQWVSENAVPIFVFLLIVAILATLILAIICLIAAPATGGLSLACSYLGILGTMEATAALLLILGINIGSETPVIAADTYAALNPNIGDVERAGAADYERETEGRQIPSSPSAAETTRSNANPSDRLLASLNPLKEQLSDPIPLLETVASNIRSIPAGGVSQLLNAARVLDNGGDANTANYIREMINRHDLA